MDSTLLLDYHISEPRSTIQVLVDGNTWREIPIDLTTTPHRIYDSLPPTFARKYYSCPKLDS